MKQPYKLQFLIILQRCSQSNRRPNREKKIQEKKKKHLSSNRALDNTTVNFFYPLYNHRNRHQHINAMGKFYS